jgi:hypothetical protein
MSLRIGIALHCHRPRLVRNSALPSEAGIRHKVHPKNPIDFNLLFGLSSREVTSDRLSARSRHAESPTASEIMLPLRSRSASHPLSCDFAMRAPGVFDADERSRRPSKLIDPHEVNNIFNDSEAPASSLVSAVLAFIWRTARL